MKNCKVCEIWVKKNSRWWRKFHPTDGTVTKIGESSISRYLNECIKDKKNSYILAYKKTKPSK